ncbi:MAG: hypothetical protein ACI4J4_09180 [Ruminiclostridium sp.]
MKKFNGKLLVSGLLTAAMVSFASVSAFAADYAVDPGYDKPEKVTEEAGTTPENPTSVVTDDTIKEVLKSDEPVVYIESDKATVKEDAIGEIAKGDKPVTFEADEYSVTIDPADIEEVKPINLAMDIEVYDEGDYEDAESAAIVITPAQKGDFGMTVTVTIPAASVKKLNTKALLVYYVSDDGEYTLLEDVVTVNADGSVSISISHASSYLITDEEILFDNDEDDDDVAVDDDADDAADDDDDMVEDGAADNNPGTGVACTAAALAAVSAAAVAVAAKKRK